MPKVLIVEDTRENIVFIANNILKPLGYTVIAARDGQTGLLKAQTEAPDLLIIDLKLPKLGGLEVLEELVNHGLDIPAIVMTFHGTEETVVRALRLGARDYLIKPFTLEEMQKALGRALKPAAGLNRQSPTLETEAKMVQLEQQLTKTCSVLAEREREFSQLQQQLLNYVKDLDLVEITQRASVWEEDNARLNEVLAQTKEMLRNAERRANALEEAMIEQRLQINKYQAEAKRLAEALQHLSEAMLLLSQDMSHQVGRLAILTPREKGDQQT